MALVDAIERASGLLQDHIPIGRAIKAAASVSGLGCLLNVVDDCRSLIGYHERFSSGEWIVAFW